MNRDLRGFLEPPTQRATVTKSAPHSIRLMIEPKVGVRYPFANQSHSARRAGHGLPRGGFADLREPLKLCCDPICE